jgi:tetratricopeptide (TPR) repeat protein
MLSLYRKFQDAIHVAILICAALAAFSNNYRHDYPLDCGHMLLDNPSIRSLKNIPSYFKDPLTFTILPANADYRPVLQVTYAFNYWISQYDTWSWHLVQILLHAICILCLYFLALRLLREFHRNLSPDTAGVIAFIAALLYDVHPVTSGVINYLSARSSLLVAAFLLPSFLLYMRDKHHGEAVGTSVPILSPVFYALALFAKVEAVGALAVYFLYDTLRIAARRSAQAADVKEKGGLIGDVYSTCNLRTLVRLAPYLAVTAVYFLIRIRIMPDFAALARKSADMTAPAYLWTQITAWWYYVGTWSAPVNLVADNQTYPIFRSPLAPPVLLALAGWVLTAGLIAAVYRKLPYIAFLAVSALALISPTSSVLPLAEMVNEHRPYLPLALASLAWLLPALSALRTELAGRRGAAVLAALGLLLLSVSLFALTFERNRVFANEESYYRDIIAKAPGSRAYVNYGLVLMKRGDYDNALKYFQLALEQSPNWHIIHINLGIAYQQTGNEARARYHFDRAVATEPYSSFSLAYRGEFFVKKKEYREALADFSAALPLTREFYRLYKGMATACAGLGRWQEALDYTRRCAELDTRQVEPDIVSIATPFWDEPELYPPGIAYFQSLETMLPGRWWVHYNIGDLANRSMQADLARREFSIAKELQQKKP